jgi:hypothetical protein
MGLYDNVRMSDSPYLSQYVGSVVPEIAQYSQLQQQRYNEAADSDDKLSEALGNLQHLGFQGDTQYANELKGQYYQRLMDRSGRGDYENMGRRTKRDAMDFVQAYQPLLQRQQDFVNIVKKVNADPNISDPDKKAQIIQYIQHMNETPKGTDGNFIRDASGKVQLNGVQDWNYAKDVDINKKLADLLSKKEADIMQSKFTTVGGFRVSTKEELRSPQVMARLAGEIMQTDPEIKSMVNRDVTLQNYKLSDQDISDGLERSAQSPYQILKRKGMNDHDIQVHAKAAGMSLAQAKQSPIADRYTAMVNQGMAPAAAKRALYNELTAQNMREPYQRQMAELMGFDRVTQEEHEDPFAVAKFKHKLDTPDGNTIFLTNPPAVDNPTDLGGITDAYQKKDQVANNTRSNLQASVMVALKNSGVLTGDPKKDSAISFDYTHDPQKLANLVQSVSGSNPQLADQLRTLGNTYKTQLADRNLSKATVEGLEQNIDLPGLYSKYIKESSKEADLQNKSLKSNKVPNLLNYNDFVAGLRSTDNPEGNWIHRALLGTDRHLQAARDEYQSKIAEAGKTFFTTPNQKISYTSMQSDKPGTWLDRTTNNVNEFAKSGALQMTNVANADESGSLAKLMGYDPTKTDGEKALRDTKILINDRLAPGGQVTATIYGGDGKTKTVSLNNLDPAISREVMRQVLKGAYTATDKTYAKDQVERTYQALGNMDMNPGADAELERMAPSSVVYPISNEFSVRIRPGGSQGKQYELYVNQAGKQVSTNLTFKSVNDLKFQLGKLSESDNK